jgi:hypothetical protein
MGILDGVFINRSHPDPEDPRRVPSSMLFIPVSLNGRTYIEWKIGELINMNEIGSPHQHPYVLEMLISAKDAREYGQTLLDLADRIESGST